MIAKFLLPAALVFAVLVAACGDSDASGTDTGADAGELPATNAGSVDAGHASDAALDAALVPPVACGAALPGVAMKSDLIEAEPGYAAALAALDLTKVADPFNMSGESKLVRGIANFMLVRSTGTSFTATDAKQSAGMGEGLLGAAAKGTGGRLDVTFLRRGLQYFYPCSRPLPKDLATLKARYGDYTTWTSATIACSKPKNGPRRLHDNHELGVYVAETLVNDVVRETEVIFSNLRDDGQLDFAVYTPEGELTDRSTFATNGGTPVTSASPFTCMSCHYDVNAGTFSARMPTGTGAGCK